MPINQRFIPNLHRKTIISISIFRNQHPYLLFTNSKILNCFVNRQHILLPDWNHLALCSFFYIIYYEHLQIFKIGSILSANDNPHHCRLSSADKNAIQVAGHYSAHIGLAPSFKLTGLQISLQSGSIIITDMLHRPVLLPHILSDFSRSIPLLQCNVSTLLHVHSKKSRHIFANLPSSSTYPHVLYAKIFSCQGTTLHHFQSMNRKGIFWSDAMQLQKPIFL